PADKDSNVETGGYNGASTDVKIYKGSTDDSSNWSLSKVDTNVDSTITGKTVNVTNITSDSGFIDITATKTNSRNLFQHTENFSDNYWTRVRTRPFGSGSILDAAI